MTRTHNLCWGSCCLVRNSPIVFITVRLSGTAQSGESTAQYDAWDEPRRVIEASISQQQADRPISIGPGDLMTLGSKEDGVVYEQQARQRSPGGLEVRLLLCS